MKTLTTHTTFIKTLDALIEQHLNDTNLTINRLTRLVGMSRTDLHRKLENTVGMSASAYIRHIRLQKAAKLLINEPNLSICQVSVEVGFTNQSYFNKRFREVFSVCPNTFRVQKQNLEHTC